MTDQEALREKNLAAVREFMGLWGPDRHVRREQLAHPDAKLFVRMSDEEPPTIYDFFEWSQDSTLNFPNYGPTDYELYQTEDPNRFLARTMGRGAKLLPDGTEMKVELPFIYGFLMDDGRIRVFEEHRDELIWLWEQHGVTFRYTTTQPEEAAE